MVTLVHDKKAQINISMYCMVYSLFLNIFAELNLINTNSEERRDKSEENRNKSASGGFETFIFTILYYILSIIV